MRGSGLTAEGLTGFLLAFALSLAIPGIALLVANRIRKAHDAANLALRRGERHGPLRGDILPEPDTERFRLRCDIGAQIFKVRPAIVFDFCPFGRDRAFVSSAEHMNQLVL